MLFDSFLTLIRMYIFLFFFYIFFYILYILYLISIPSLAKSLLCSIIMLYVFTFLVNVEDR